MRTTALSARVQGWSRSEELEAEGKASAACWAVASGRPGRGWGTGLSYAWRTTRASVSCRAASFSVWGVENARRAALVEEMATPSVLEGAEEKPSFSWEVEKGCISSVWEGSTSEGKASAGGEVEKASFVGAVVWETCAVAEEEREKESAAFWWVVVMDFSSVYYEGKSPSGAFVVRERHSWKGNVSAACLPHHSSRGIFWVAHLLRRKRSQSQMKTAGSVVCTGVSAAQNLLQPICHLCLLLIQIILLF